MQASHFITDNIKKTYTQRLNLKKINTFYSFLKDILQGIVLCLAGGWLDFYLQPVVTRDVVATGAIWGRVMHTERPAVLLTVALVSSVQMPTR